MTASRVLLSTLAFQVCAGAGRKADNELTLAADDGAGLPPVIDKIFPLGGPSNGNTVVTVHGTNMKKVTKCLFGEDTEENLIDAKSTTDTSVVCEPAPLLNEKEEPRQNFRVGVGDGIYHPADADVANAKYYQYYALPKITEISPKAGPTSGNTSVTFTGSGFNVIDGTNTEALGFQAKCKFGDKEVPVKSISSDGKSGVCIAPEMGFPVNLIFKMALNGQNYVAASKIAHTFKYYNPPTITEITPKKGPSTGGTKVTIYGDFTALGDVKGKCQFSSPLEGEAPKEVDAKVDNVTYATCVTPKLASGKSTVRFALNGQDFAGGGNKTSLNFESVFVMPDEPPPPPQADEPTPLDPLPNETARTWLTGAVSAGFRRLPVNSTSGFEVGSKVIVAAGTDSEEEGVVEAFGSIQLASPIKSPHKKLDWVVQINYGLKPTQPPEPPTDTPEPTPTPEEPVPTPKPPVVIPEKEGGLMKYVIAGILLLLLGFGIWKCTSKSGPDSGDIQKEQ